MPQYDEFGDIIPGTEEDNEETPPIETDPPETENPPEGEDPPTTEEPPEETPPEEGPVIVGDWNLTEIDEYITYHAIDNEDFLDADNVLKVKYLNVAIRTLKRAFKGATIPDNATYLFAAVLGANFNDTIVQAQRGVSSFNVDGISFAFKNFANKELDDLISDDIKGLIEEANPDDGSGNGSNGKIKWVTL